MDITPVLDKAKGRLISLIDGHGLRGESVRVTIGPLSTDQAIGQPARQDFALLGGKEIMIEARFKQSYGQAFTSRPREFNGLLDEVLKLSLESIDNRAIFTATMNAVCAHLGFPGKTRHCRNEEPEECGKKIANELFQRLGKVKIGMIGYQPAILDNLARTFGADNVRCNDLDVRNIGTNKSGVVIGNGKNGNGALIKWCDVALATGSTIVNNSFDSLYREAVSQHKEFINFGVTISGVAALLAINALCPCGH
jgi:uncharacterized protein (DUF4213/DUF364 family)